MTNQVSEALEPSHDPPAALPNSESLAVTETPQSPIVPIASKDHMRSGSILTVSSSESTEKLIKSLSSGKLGAAAATMELSEVGNVSPVLGSPTQQPLPKNETPKPIKFTVRKVSRDTIVIPDPNTKRGHVREYAYGNLPQNREKLLEHRLGDKQTQLQQNQQKYDLYVNRIDKINKEISFLTNLLPPYNVEIDYVTRTKITKAIEKLQMKQDEIEKKKYSLGISISRLWREHNENEIFVRSVSKQ